MKKKVEYQKLKVTDGLSSIEGFFKKWIYQNTIDRERVANYLQKYNFSISDVNKIIEKINKCKKIVYDDVICIIVYLDWIIKACYEIKKLIKKNLIDHFNYSNKNTLDKKCDFFNAIRSFVIAHPLNTNRHHKYGLSGNYICADFFGNRNYISSSYKYNHISLDGLQSDHLYENDDLFLKVYSNEDPFFHRVFSFKLNDLLECGNEYLSLMHELNKFLLKSRKKDYK